MDIRRCTATSMKTPRGGAFFRLEPWLAHAQLLMFFSSSKTPSGGGPVQLFLSRGFDCMHGGLKAGTQ